MKNPAITLAIDSHGKTPMVSLSFEKDRRLVGKMKAKDSNIIKIKK